MSMLLILWVESPTKMGVGAVIGLPAVSRKTGRLAEGCDKSCFVAHSNTGEDDTVEISMSSTVKKVVSCRRVIF
jgi:hypothetical protein